MSRAITRRPRAVQDLLGHYAYIFQGSPAAAERFLAAADSTFDSLARMPGLGHVFETDITRLRDIRVWPIRRFRKYLVLYRFSEDEVEILHVFHGAQDISGILEAEESEQE